jgi:hypothetical protein
MAAQIDVRTRTMSLVALKCRTEGHWMDDVAVAPRIRTEHHARGQRLLRLECHRRVNGQGCGRWREIITDMDTGEIIGQRGSYEDPDEYLVQTTGTGRLPRSAARVALHSRVGERKDYRRPVAAKTRSSQKG